MDTNIVEIARKTEDDSDLDDGMLILIVVIITIIICLILFLVNVLIG